MESFPQEIISFYATGKETGRLDAGIGPLERLRSQQLIERYLPPAPADIVDIGGGPGVYANWLADRGHTVHLLDIVPLHVQQAQTNQPAGARATYSVGDARRLPLPSGCADLALLNGPLYHLTERADRLAALREARRVLRPGGTLLSIVISRYASVHVAFTRWWLDDDDLYAMIERELSDGQHIQPANRPDVFARAYFHHPDEIAPEITAAGLTFVESLAVEGSGWLIPDFAKHWADPADRARLLALVERMEREPTIVGFSPHILTVARREMCALTAR